MSKSSWKWHGCNVALADESSVRLWQTHLSGDKFVLRQEITGGQDNPLPETAVIKKWKHLIRNRLDIGWMPYSQVFLRVVQLPECEPEEFRDMLEFQLEKLAPLPVAQIVWSYETIPSSVEGQVTALVIAAEIRHVESQLELLERTGFQADRLEVPWCHELTTLDRERDRIWIRLALQQETAVVLAAWVLDRTIRHVAISEYPDNDQGRTGLIDQLRRTAWTGELEGWQQSLPPVTLCCPEEHAAPWRQALKSWSPHPLESQDPPKPKEAAQLSAQRAAQGLAQANLQPEGHRIRYRQHFIDSIWMKGVAGMIMAYVLIVLVFFVLLEWIGHQESNLSAQVRTIAPQYTNVIKMEQQIGVMREQQDLREYALECLTVVAASLPTGFTLQNFNFTYGQTLTLRGDAGGDGSQALVDFRSALLAAQFKDKALFRAISEANPLLAEAKRLVWNLTCELNRSSRQ